MGSQMSRQRLDIQTLRGWAVALVVMDHARLEPFHGGFMGVDIFFVISGFLITGIIARDLDAGSFSFREFYLKRARRILPAAYATMILTALGAIWFMTSIEFRDLEDQITGGVTFTINFVLMWQADYFAPEADTKPLLHLWSLAIEEQFYLLLPALLFVTPARWRRGMVIALAGLSFVACLIVAASDPTAAFYLLPTRAWELLIGAVVALYWVALSAHARIWRVLFWPALAGLLLIPTITIGQHPGPQALAICLCAAVVILAERPWLGAIVPLRWLGDISYSLYLVHWPIAVFAFSSYYGVPTLELKLLVVGLSVLLAVAMYALVERPARAHFTNANWRAVAASLIGAFAVVGSYSVAQAATPKLQEFANIRRTNYGLSGKCNFRKVPFSTRAECATAESPPVMVWGDSFAMHLVDGLVASGQPIRQATLSACAPILGQASLVGQYDEKWARNCIKFNDDVLKHIEASPYRVVFIASPWTTMVGQTALLRDGKGEFRASVTDFETSLASLRVAVERIRASGKRAILVEPPPNAGMDYNVSTCAERLLSGKFIFGGRPGCQFDRIEYETRAANPVAFIARAEREFGLPVLKISEVLCSGDTCNSVIDGTAMFRDRSHLSKDGSRLVMTRAGVDGLIGQSNAAMIEPQR